MKYKLLSVDNGGKQNIGDFIQALAASQFLPKIDGFVNREALSDYNGEECKIIMNGWYMHHPEKWPPSKKIIPLFIAFHLNDTVKEKMLSEEGVCYLRQHAPIGCRDKHTVELLKSKGIDAYFSGCLTLTLGKNYKSNIKSDKVIVVDPIIPKSKKIKDVVLDIVGIISNGRIIKKISKELVPSKNVLKRYVLTSRFYRTYSKWFDSESLENAKYIVQESEKYKNSFGNDIDRLKEAERLVREYSQSSFVITSRIHCALPCIGLETPVYFIRKNNDSFVSTCRFDGIVDLFNVFNCDETSIQPEFEITGRIGKKNIVLNKEIPEAMIDRLCRTCETFIE